MLVPLSDRVVEVLTWDGTRFEPFDLVANNILAAGTVAAKHLAADSVTAEKVKANAITADKLAANSRHDREAGDRCGDRWRNWPLIQRAGAQHRRARHHVPTRLAANSVTTAKLKVTEDMTVALVECP